MKKENLSQSRRSFIRGVAAGALGAGLAWKFGGTLALGQIPWESKLDTVKMDETSDVDLSEMYKLLGDIKNESPCIVFDSSGKLWVAWISERENGEQIYLTSFENGQWGEEILLSESEGIACDPQIVVVRDGIAVAWVEKRKASWDLTSSADQSRETGANSNNMFLKGNQLETIYDRRPKRSNLGNLGTKTRGTF